MTDSQKVDQYLKKHSQWTEQLSTLRALFLNTELKEEIKWGAPAYTLNGAIVSGLGAFNNHYAIWFHLHQRRCITFRYYEPGENDARNQRT